MKSSIPLLTPLRGVAALIVVLFHARLVLFPHWKTPIQSSSAFLENGFIWVDLFFILSGFVLTKVYLSQFNGPVTSQQWKRFLALRFSRIYPLFALTLAVLIGWESYKASINLPFYGGPLLESWGLIGQAPFEGPFNTVPDIFAHLFMLNGFSEGLLTWNISAWSLSIEWFGYMMLPWILSGLFKSQSARATWWLPAFCLLLLVSLIGNYNTLDVTGGIGALMRGLIGIVLGAWLASFRVPTALKRNINHDLVVIATLITPFLLLHFPLSKSLTVGVYISFAVLVWVAGNQEHRSSMVFKMLENRVTNWLGDISYGLYLWHFIVLIIGVEALNKWHPERLTAWYQETSIGITAVAILAFLALTAAIATLFFYFFELPMQRWLRHRLTRQSSPQISGLKAE